jgi:hypothetical protein
MKLLLLWLISLLFCFQMVMAYQETIIDRDNQWGGKTTQTEFKENGHTQDVIIYAEVNNFYQLGVNKILEYYDLDKVLRKASVFYNSTLETKHDFKQVTDFFDQNGNHIKSEQIFNTKFSSKKGIVKKTTYFKNSGFNQDVFFFTHEQTKKQGYYKLILYKDFTGDVVKIERFNHQNQLLPEPP